MSSTIKKIALAASLGITFYCNQSMAFVVYDPTNYIQNAMTAKNSVESLVNQAKQLQFEVQNIQRLSNGNFDNARVLNQLTKVARQGHALSYGDPNVDDEFINKFSGLTSPVDYYQDFMGWAGTTYDTLKNSLFSMSLQGKLFDKENEDIKELQSLSNQVGGNLEAAQTSHRIAIQEIAQTQKLRQLLLTQGSAQHTFMAYQLQKDQSQQAAMHEWINNSQVAFHKYSGDEGFGSDELPDMP